MAVLTNGSGLPDLPDPAKAPVTEDIKLTLAGDLMADIKAYAAQKHWALDVAVAQCVVKWRNPPHPVAVASNRRGRQKGKVT